MGKGWLRNLKQAETGIFLRAICVNLCESVDNPSPLSRIRVIREDSWGKLPFPRFFPICVNLYNLWIISKFTHRFRVP